MKKSLFFTTFSASLIVGTSITLLYINTPAAILCEGPSPFSEETLFWKIEEKSRGVWDILFKNVNVRYEVTASFRTNVGDFQNQDFRFKQTSTPPSGSVSASASDLVDKTRISNNIHEAAMHHFNDIQGGYIHPDLPNYINPNAHGRGTMGRANSPLDQFFIREYMTLLIILLSNLKLSFTNMGFYLTLSAFISSALSLIATNFRKLVSNLWSSSQESIYATIHSIVINQINAIKGQSYFPFIYVLFVFILTSNLIGMIPYSFSTTSHFILTFFISFTVVVGSTFLGFQLHFIKFLSILVPSGCPLPLLPLLVLIEFISYLARNVSLGLRLAANVLSGHMLLNILSGFVYNIMKAGIIYFLLSFIPLSFIMAFSALEIAISFIQAQVFSVLSGSYIKDGLDLH